MTISTKSKSWFNPVNVLTALVIIVILFEGIGWTYDNLQNQSDATQRAQIRENTEDLKHILQAQGNLSANARESLVKAINTTYYEIFPEINDALQDIREAQPQSNFTAQKEGVANIEKILENQERLLQLLNATR